MKAWGLVGGRAPLAEGYDPGRQGEGGCGGTGSASQSSCPTVVYFSYSLLFRLHSRHMDIPRLGVESELQLPATATATATQCRI